MKILDLVGLALVGAAVYVGYLYIQRMTPTPSSSSAGAGGGTDASGSETPPANTPPPPATGQTPGTTSPNLSNGTNPAIAPPSPTGGSKTPPQLPSPGAGHDPQPSTSDNLPPCNEKTVSPVADRWLNGEFEDDVFDRWLRTCPAYTSDGQPLNQLL